MFDLPYHERVRAWRDFRLTNSYLDREEILVNTAKLWWKAPQAMPYLAYDQPETWPQPWELIQYDRFDDVSIGLGIYFTLYLTDRFDKRDLDVVIYNNDNESAYTVAVDVYKKYTLNWSVGEVVNTSLVEQRAHRQWVWNYAELRTESYL
jgi:hypothetical protein